MRGKGGGRVETPTVLRELNRNTILVGEKEGKNSSKKNKKNSQEKKKEKKQK